MAIYFCLVIDTIKSLQYLSCIKPQYQKERKYGVLASVNIIQVKNMCAIQWGIIGCGNVVRYKSGGAFNIKDKSNVYCIMSRNISNDVQSYALENNIPFWTTDVNELINNENINAVYIATPPSSHYEYALMSIKSGKHIYVEKPLALTGKQCRLLLKAANEYHVRIFTAYYRRALPHYRKIWDIIQSGKIGMIRQVIIRQERKYPNLSYRVPWRLQPQISGGGLFEDIAVHTLDLLDMYFGKVQEINSFYMNQKKSTAAADNVAVIAKYPNDVAMSANWYFDSYENKDSIEIMASEGKIEFSMNVSSPVYVHIKEAIEVIRPNQYLWIQSPLIENVVDAIINSQKAYSTGDNACRVADIVEKIKRV